MDEDGNKVFGKLGELRTWKCVSCVVAGARQENGMGGSSDC